MKELGLSQVSLEAVFAGYEGEVTIDGILLCCVKLDFTGLRRFFKDLVVKAMLG